MKFVPKDPINNIPALIQIMAWRQPGDKPLSEPMMICLLTYASLGLNELFAMGQSYDYPNANEDTMKKVGK